VEVKNLAQKRQQRFNVSPAQVEKSLKGTHFPAEKQDLIQKAKENNANQDVLEVLENMPDKQFNSPVDISKAMGRM
jgi:predicted transcriptional regulator